MLPIRDVTPETMNCRLVLVSASQRRRKILADLGYTFDVVVADVEEVFYADDPKRTAKENALRKNEWCRLEFPDRITIAADTIIEFQGASIAKPTSLDDAHSMFRAFSGKIHNVLTAVALFAPGRPLETRVVTSSVEFLDLDDRTIEDYFSKVDPLDKAGAYDIDQTAELIIRSYSGSYTNIMGLPAEAVLEWLEQIVR